MLRKIIAVAVILISHTLFSEELVFITETGSKYHRDGCKYLGESKKSITLSEAVALGYEPGKVCDAPVLHVETENASLDISEELALPGLMPGDVVVTYTGFSLVYSEEHEQAKWVAYVLTKEEAAGGHDRTDNFREDPRITTGTASGDDYRYSGYDRGHLAPAADFDLRIPSCPL